VVREIGRETLKEVVSVQLLETESCREDGADR